MVGIKQLIAIVQFYISSLIVSNFSTASFSNGGYIYLFVSWITWHLGNSQLKSMPCEFLVCSLRNLILRQLLVKEMNQLMLTAANTNHIHQSVATTYRNNIWNPDRCLAFGNQHKYVLCLMVARLLIFMWMNQSVISLILFPEVLYFLKLQFKSNNPS